MGNAPHGTGDRSPGRKPSTPADPRAVAGDETALLHFLVQSAKDLNSSLKLEEVFCKLAERIRPFVDFQLFCILLWNEDTRRLELTFSQSFGETVECDDSLPLGTGVSGSCAALGRPVRVADVTSHDAYVRHPCRGGEIRSELAVPLLHQDRLIGVLDVESTTPDAYTEEHEQVLVALASHVAIAIENARLYERTAEQERRLETDLATAREIQRSLLKPSIPELPGVDIGTGYLPARTLGGDFYDFLALGEDRLAVAVGDVAGKGTPAALYGSLAVGTMRGHIVQHVSRPAEVLGHLNAHLHRPSIDNRFVAMAFGIFDGRDRSLVLANAGFTQPILIRRGRLERIPVRGVPLGLLLGVSYEEHRLELARGDLVAFVSDGLQESIDGQGEQFGDRFLEDVLRALETVSAPQIARGLIRASTAYAGEHEERPDDRSVVVLKIR